MKDSVYFGGVPTGPDVKKIRDKWPDDSLKPGTSILYSDISDLISVDEKDSRFRTVTTRWRRLVEKESGKFIGAAGNGMFKVLDEHGKFDLHKNKFRSSIKASRRSYVVGSSVDVSELNEHERNMLTFTQQKNSKVLQIGQLRSGKKLLPEI